MKKHHDEFQQNCVGAAMVMSSVLLRMALRSLLFIAPMPMPHKVVGTLSEGEDWCFGRLRSAGVTPPLLMTSFGANADL